MNLVYNVVSQKEAETSLAIDRDTKNDSSSMKVIAGLTMVFRPGTAVTSFFGMNFFEAQNGKLKVASELWLFLAVTVPLTILIIVVWWLWEILAIEGPSKLSLATFDNHVQSWRRRLGGRKKNAEVVGKGTV